MLRFNFHSSTTSRCTSDWKSSAINYVNTTQSPHPRRSVLKEHPLMAVPLCQSQVVAVVVGRVCGKCQLQIIHSPFPHSLSVSSKSFIVHKSHNKAIRDNRRALTRWMDNRRKQRRTDKRPDKATGRLQQQPGFLLGLRLQPAKRENRKRQESERDVTWGFLYFVILIITGALGGIHKSRRKELLMQMMCRR